MKLQFPSEKTFNSLAAVTPFIHFDGETILLKRNSKQGYGSPSSTLKGWSLKPQGQNAGKNKNQLYTMRGQKRA